VQPNCNIYHPSIRYTSTLITIVKYGMHVLLQHWVIYPALHFFFLLFLSLFTFFSCVRSSFFSLFYHLWQMIYRIRQYFFCVTDIFFCRKRNFCWNRTGLILQEFLSLRCVLKINVTFSLVMHYPVVSICFSSGWGG
jgi:hypothetical protein